MNYVYSAIGWVWSRKLFFLTITLSAIVFFAWQFPFSDLSDVVTTSVAQATGGEVYVQFDELDLHFVPQPAVSATNASVDFGLPALEAKYLKFTPNLLSILTSLPTVIRAASGNAEAAGSLGAKLGATVDGEGVLGGDVSLSLRPGSKSDGGHDRSRVTVAIDKVNLNEVQKWADLPVKLQGALSFESDVQLAAGLQEQPEGDYNIRVAKFNLPAGTVMVPFNGVVMPLNLPGISLANVQFKGRLTNGKLFIEDGSFGQSKDPFYGRLKGNMGLRLMSRGAGVNFGFGAYDFTLDLTTTAPIEKELGFAFFLLGPGKSGLPGGGAHYLVKAQGSALDGSTPPTITRASSF